jgi:hypothetical protein
MAVELAVGHDLEPQLLLQAHHLADRRLLNRPDLGVGDLLPFRLLARFDQRVGTDQAADVIGAKGRLGAFHSWFSDGQVPTCNARRKR